MSYLIYNDKKPPHIKITGLHEYWHNKGEIFTSIDMDIKLNDISIHHAMSIPISKKQTLNYAVELCCAKLLLILQSQKK